MIAETQKAPEGAYCAPALRRSIFSLRAKDGWIISTLTLKSSLRFLPCPAVKAHDSIRADQSQNASKVDRKKVRATLTLAPRPRGDLRIVPPPIRKKAVLACGELLSTETRLRSGRGEVLTTGEKGRVMSKNNAGARK